MAGKRLHQHRPRAPHSRRDQWAAHYQEELRLFHCGLHVRVLIVTPWNEERKTRLSFQPRWFLVTVTFYFCARLLLYSFMSRSHSVGSPDCIILVPQHFQLESELTSSSAFITTPCVLKRHSFQSHQNNKVLHDSGSAVLNLGKNFGASTTRKGCWRAHRPKVEATRKCVR